MTVSDRSENNRAGQASVAFGFVSLGFSTLAVLVLDQARTTEFIHGQEFVWLLAYLIPLVLSLIALIFALVHAVRRRFAGIFAWLPAVISLPLVGWLVAYIFFDAFRNS
jgi:pheromone shutdown protein TraB